MCVALSNLPRRFLRSFRSEMYLAMVNLPRKSLRSFKSELCKGEPETNLLHPLGGHVYGLSSCSLISPHRQWRLTEPGLA
jgi:hypothetical protein